MRALQASTIFTAAHGWQDGVWIYWICTAKMIKRKSTDFIFRELQGPEMKLILLEHLTSEFRAALEKAIDGTNQFYIGNSYPVVTISGDLSVNVLPSEKEPPPFLISVKMELGKDISSSPDRIRELFGIPVLQPKKIAKGFLVNQPIEAKHDNQETRPDRD